MRDNKKIPHLCRPALQNFPFIENNIDALTDYGIESKIIEYLNKVIDSQNNVTEQQELVEGKFDNLKAYVMGYFDNLDVQDEINNKLDALVADGTLENIIKKYLKLQDKIIVIGDSWSDLDVTDAVWSPIVANNVHCELTNYAKSGAGFLYTANSSIDTQVTNFSNSQIDKDTVKYIILFGGINDYRHNITSDDLANKITSIVGQLKQIAPKANIYYISNCQYPDSQTQAVYWIDLHNKLSTKVSISTYNLNGTFGKALFNPANYFHPSANGSKFIARNITNILNGGELIRFTSASKVTSGDATINYDLHVEGNYIVADFVFATNTAGNSFTFNIPEGVSFGEQNYFISQTGFGYNTILVNPKETSISVASQNNVTVGRKYVVSARIPVFVI